MESVSWTEELFFAARVSEQSESIFWLSRCTILTATHRIYTTHAHTHCTYITVHAVSWHIWSFREQVTDMVLLLNLSLTNGESNPDLKMNEDDAERSSAAQKRHRSCTRSWSVGKGQKAQAEQSGQARGSEKKTSMEVWRKDQEECNTGTASRRKTKNKMRKRKTLSIVKKKKYWTRLVLRVTTFGKTNDHLLRTATATARNAYLKDSIAVSRFALLIFAKNRAINFLCVSFCFRSCA
jgi:hypothetical protein